MSQQTVAAQDMIARFGEGKDEGLCRLLPMPRTATEFRMAIGTGHHRMPARRQRCARDLANTAGFVDVQRE
jgi:hypothetical protein